MDYFWYPERQAGFPVRNRLRYRYEGLAPVVVPTPDKQTTDANNEKKTKQNKTTTGAWFPSRRHWQRLLDRFNWNDQVQQQQRHNTFGTKRDLYTYIGSSGVLAGHFTALRLVRLDVRAGGWWNR